MASNKHGTILSYIWLSVIIIVISFLTIDLVIDILYPIAKFQPLSYGGRISCYYAYFTTETNYLVVIYFTISLIRKFRDKGSIIKFEVGLALVVYITITMIIFWGSAIVNFWDPEGTKGNLSSSPSLTIYRWFSTSVLHIVVPVFMIVNYIFVISGYEHYNIKTYHRFWLWILQIYPLIYFIYIMARGEARYLLGSPNNTLYPYEFLNYRGFVNLPVDIGIFLGFVFVIFGLCFSLQYFYLWINNLVFKKYNNKTML